MGTQQTVFSNYQHQNLEKSVHDNNSFVSFPLKETPISSSLSGQPIKRTNVEIVISTKYSNGI